MTARVYLVDREDQAKWFADPQWTTVSIKLDKSHRLVREWIEEGCQGIVVISGQGRIPPAGGVYHPTDMIFEHIQRDQYKIYFELDADAVLFKLAWGGAQDD